MDQDTVFWESEPVTMALQELWMSHIRRFHIFATALYAIEVILFAALIFMTSALKKPNNSWNAMMVVLAMTAVVLVAIGVYFLHVEVMNEKL